MGKRKDAKIKNMTKTVLEAIEREKENERIICEDAEAVGSCSVEWVRVEEEHELFEDIKGYVSFYVAGEPRVVFHRHSSGELCLEYVVMGAHVDWYYPFCEVMGVSEEELTQKLMMIFVDAALEIRGLDKDFPHEKGDFGNGRIVPFPRF